MMQQNYALLKVKKGWQSYVGPHGKLVLDTLFVHLKNPPHMVKFDGLPEM